MIDVCILNDCSFFFPCNDLYWSSFNEKLDYIPSEAILFLDFAETNEKTKSAIPRCKNWLTQNAHLHDFRITTDHLLREIILVLFQNTAMRDAVPFRNWLFRFLTRTLASQKLSIFCYISLVMSIWNCFGVLKTKASTVSIVKVSV